MVARENRGAVGGRARDGRGNGRMGNSKEREAGEMSGGKLRHHSFQKKKGAEAGYAKYGRRELRFGPPHPAPPPPLPHVKEACILFSRMCLSFAPVVLICYFCLFALLFFSFVLFLVKKRRPKLC